MENKNKKVNVTMQCLNVPGGMEGRKIGIGEWDKDHVVLMFQRRAMPGDADVKGFISVEDGVTMTHLRISKSAVATLLQLLQGSYLANGALRNLWLDHKSGVSSESFVKAEWIDDAPVPAPADTPTTTD